MNCSADCSAVTSMGGASRTYHSVGCPNRVSPVSGNDKRVYEWLRAAGITAEGDKVRRVVIDIKAGDAVKVYVERYGDTRMLDVFPPDMSGCVIESVDRAAS